FLCIHKGHLPYLFQSHLVYGFDIDCTGAFFALGEYFVVTQVTFGYKRPAGAYNDKLSKALQGSSGFYLDQGDYWNHLVTYQAYEKKSGQTPYSRSSSLQVSRASLVIACPRQN